MSNKEIGLAPFHIPTVASGDYNIEATLVNDLNNGKKQEIKFSVAGYNASIPQNEVLAVYPPIEHTGNFAGTFPHIQFRRSTLPWEYKVTDRIKEEDCKKALLLNTSEDKINFLTENNIFFDKKVYETIKNDKGKLSFLDSILNGAYLYPYIFLVLLKEEEIKGFEFITTDTNKLNGSTESPDEPKPLKVITCNNSDLFPKADLVQKLAHVRVQEHTELKDLNLPKETSILISHRMVEPKTKYKAFVCYYAKLNNKSEYEVITDLTDESAIEYAVILNEWSFESIRAELYQVDKKKLENYPYKDKLPKDIMDSEIVALDLKNIDANSPFYPFKELIDKNLKYLEDRKERWDGCKENTKSDDFEKGEEGKEDNNHILEYLQYNGKNLKGYLHELVLQPFKTFLKNKISEERIEDYPSHIKSLLDISKVPLEHQLKAGGKMVSWYQGPFTNNSNNFDLLQLLADQKIETIPDHQDYLNLFNEDTGMYDMTYSAAWQLGRLIIMNDNKVLQELKKWKYDLELYNLVVEQNKLSHLPNLSILEPSIPDVLMNYVTELIQFRNFPLYYLLPHADLSTEESIKHFKIDNSWIFAFLFGIFSAGPKLKISDFTKYLYRKEIFDRTDNNKIKTKLDEFLSNLAKRQLVEELKNNIILDCKSIIESNSEKETTFYNRVIEILNRMKNEMWYVFNNEKDYYGILLQSQTIKNWPHIVVELNESHDFHNVISINNSLRLYVTDQKIESIELYLKNENAHFGKEYKSNDNQFITPCQDSVTTANNNLYKQPRVVFNLK